MNTNAANENRTPVTVLGLGPMGQALAGAFLKAGHPTTVWNRTAGKADALVAQGAALAGTVVDAVAASPLVIVCVLDYNAANAILAPAADALKGRTLVNLTADSPERAREMAAWAAARGIDYLDGAIMTPTPTIGQPTAVLLYSGPEAVYEANQPALASLGGTPAYLGTDPGRAAAYDVALLDIYWTAMSGYMHALALARAEHIAAKDLAAYARGIVGIMPDIMTELAQQVDDGRYPGDKSNILSAAASMEHIIHVAQARGIDAGVLSAAHTVARRAIDAGQGTDGFSLLAELFGKPSA
ncbi:NAD(P)-dependent oxidoreductase [Paenibacillus ehimensis]|uniref:NAD(P)-binding domain-containing protein n=1 Tax=Paenibacillus ehimensis TaxID=79264 RepID=A0ABT8V6V4_9BACL|nr:NAD(P)-binding domain-containing protein [Paenibacillus ehimensis]MDO3677172.1 NAD(P)-binding domain-containing protein [Paenibacillus ehimensis]MEC0212926.1 NAD(P)-binding domain-containing protein [Paenibacillus ehimensis]